MKATVELTGKVVVPAAANKARGLRIFESPGSTILKIKKILVPVDFSECSKKALRYGIQLAREFCATVDVLYVVPPYYAYDPCCVAENERIEKELRVNGEQKLAAMVLQQIPQGLPVETFVRNGRPATEIVEAAGELGADLIVISTHGHTGLRHALMGSTAENVVRHAPCPVLTVREKEHEFLA
jgi:universal stress protein A